MREIAVVQVQRFIRLTGLLKCLLDLVDEKKLKLNPAVEISYLSMGEQMTLVDAMGTTHKIPTLAQAKEIRQLSQKGSFELREVKRILTGENPDRKKEKKDERKIIIQSDEIRRFFPENVTEKEIEAKDLHDIPSSVIIQLARILHTSPNYLLLGEVKEEGWMEEMYELMENIKSPEMRRLALKQLRCVAEV